MIRGIILFYLNIKPTHGYEIQRFIQLSGFDQWTKIQSGSIYYALTKLEKEKNIRVFKEERTGSRVRKIFEITEEGRKALQEEMKRELATPLFDIGSSKFITSPILATLPKEEMIKIINNHIEELKQMKDYWSIWQEKKCTGQKHGLNELSFQISIDSIGHQISWHKELLEHLDDYIVEAKTMKTMIAAFDADSFKNADESTENEERLEFLNSVKKAVADSPEAALENINTLIDQIKRQM